MQSNPIFYHANNNIYIRGRSDTRIVTYTSIKNGGVKLVKYQDALSFVLFTDVLRMNHGTFGWYIARL
jgi:hypothetical protein